MSRFQVSATRLFSRLFSAARRSRKPSRSRPRQKRCTHIQPEPQKPQAVSSSETQILPFPQSGLSDSQLWKVFYLVASANAVIWFYWQDDIAKWGSDTKWREDYKKRRLEALAVGGLEGLNTAHGQIPALPRHFYLSYSNLHHEGLHVLVTHGFSHIDRLHLAGNLVLLINAVPLASQVGLARVAVPYLAGIVWGGLAGLIEAQYRPDRLHTCSLGASAGVCAVLATQALLSPSSSVVMFSILDGIPASYALALFGSWDVYNLVSGTRDGVGHAAHIAGMIAGGVLVLARHSFLAHITFVAITAGVVCQVVDFKNSLFSKWDEDSLVKQRLVMTHNTLDDYYSTRQQVEVDVILTSPFNPFWAHKVKRAKVQLEHEK